MKKECIILRWTLKRYMTLSHELFCFICWKDWASLTNGLDGSKLA